MINGHNQNLPNIFGTTGFFRIPDYQRGYAWGKKQLTELWEDLEDIQKKPNSNDYRPHYTGMISLKAIPKANLLPDEVALTTTKAAEFFDVVDGQQRLTTLLILLYVLSQTSRNNRYLVEQFIRTKGKKPIYRFCYGQSNSHNNNNCLMEIFEDPHNLPYNSNVYTNNLKYAKDFFTNKVSSLKNQQEKNELIGKIINALQFDIKVIDVDLDVQVVFETMNNRGKELTILEKLKNRLMYLASKQSSSSLSHFINQSWGTIYEYLGKNQILIDEDEYISSHLTLLREPADYSFSVKDAERKVFEMFCSRANKFKLSDKRDQGDKPKMEPKVDENKIQSYASDIAQFVPYWYQINNLDLKDDIDKQMYIIKCMNDSKEMRIFLAQMASMAKSAKQEVIDCLALIERILFINRLPIRDKVIDERRFANFARDLHSNNLALQQLINKLNQDLMTLPISVASISEGFKGLFAYVYSRKGYHRWSGLKYFLFKYEEDIRKDKYPKDFPILEWTRFEETSIEHILPQDTSKWQQEMNSYFSGKTLSADDKKEAEKILINSLGNLTILRDIKNPSLSNEPWLVKQPAYSSGCFMEKEVSKYTCWNATTIYKRGKLMIDFMKKLIPVLNNMNDPCDYESMLFCDKKYLP